MTERNEFLKYWSLGYTRLVPIIPPDANISERSSLFRALGTKADPRGKAVGIKRRDGLWGGFDWIPYEADEEDIMRWHRMGAGIGIKTGNGLLAVDADTKNADWARIIRDTAEKHFGRTPIRVGNYPKALYLIRCSEPYRYTRVEFGERNDKGRLLDRVEILSDGRQFVAHGIHPNTKQPYHWPREIVPIDELKSFTADEIDAFMQELRGNLPQAAELVREGASTEISQQSLKGDLEAIRKAVQATPNTTEHFPSREAYRDYGYAIKAALPDAPNEAYAIYEDWCAQWVGPEKETNDPATVKSDWNRMKPPYRRGANYIYELAEQYSNGKFTLADVWFDDMGDKADNPFEAANVEDQAQHNTITATPYGFPDPTEIQPRQWIYGQHYIRKFVSATVAPSGVGKSSLEIVEALVMASGKPLLGVEPKGQFRVWLWNGEDPRDELERRIAAAMLHYGLTRQDIGDRLFVDTGRETEIVLATETRNGVLISQPVADAVLRQIRLNGIDVLQIDPFVSSHRVSENDNGAIDLVTKQWAKLADAGNCSIELVHHVRKLNGAEITVEDSRGATALLATSRSARAVARMSKGEAQRFGLGENAHRRLFRFGDGKNNLALPASDATEWFELRSVGLGNGAGAGIEGLMNGDHVGVVTRYTVPEGAALGVMGDDKETALALVRGGEWRRDIRAGEAWIGVAIAQAMKLDAQDAEDKARINAIISAWIKDGTLVEVTKKDAKRRQKTFVEAAEYRDTVSQDIFD